MTTSETEFNALKPGPWTQVAGSKGHGILSLINESGLRPLGHAVLVLPYEIETAKSLIQLPDHVKERNKMIEARVIVIDVGSAAWDDEDVPRAMPGDKVMIARYTGNMVQGPADGKSYRVVNDRDIYCQITKEK